MPGTPTGITIQSDTLAPIAGGPVRMLTTTVPLQGVATQVQQQVVVVADPNGVLVDNPVPVLNAMLEVLKDQNAILEELRAMMASFVGWPVVDQGAAPTSIPTLTQ